MKLSTRLRRLAIVLPVLWSAESVHADNGIPALLQFAESYSSNQGEFASQPSEGPVSQPAPIIPSDSPVLRRALKERDAMLASQRAILQQQTNLLEAEIARRVNAEEKLKKQTEQLLKTQSFTADWMPLRKIVIGLRNAMGRLPEDQLKMSIGREQGDVVREAHEKISEQQKQIEALTRRLQEEHSAKNSCGKGIAAELEALQKKVDDKSSELVQHHQLLATERQQNQALKTELKALQTSQKDLRTTLSARLQKEKVALSGKLVAMEQEFAVVEKRVQDLQLVTEQKEAMLSALKLENTTLQDQRYTLEGQVSEGDAKQAELLQKMQTKDDDLHALEKRIQDLQLITDQKETLLSTLQNENKTLKDQHAALALQISEGEAKQAKQTELLHKLQTEADGLRTRDNISLGSQKLNEPSLQQAYAAGDALGRDILKILQERKSWGVSADPQIVLSGVVDAFSGKNQLSPEELSKALADSEHAVNLAREKMMVSQQEKGELFVDNFKKQKGVKQASSGFWFRVDYQGDDQLHENDIVDVVVKEMLTDGTVIQDMSLTGKVLSQPLSAYPPLFREAIGNLSNHGSMTMVVPPEMAYGDAGYPPEVPPSSTMVYELRIDNSRAEPVDHVP